MSVIEMPMDDERFQTLLKRLFGPGIAPGRYGGIDGGSESRDDREKRLQIVRRVFMISGELVKMFGDESLAIGLPNLVSSNSSNELTLLNDEDLDEKLRIGVIDAMKFVFLDCFAPRCTPHLSHLEEIAPNPLNGTCYMWWEHVPLFGRPDNPARKNIDAAAIAVMRDCLRLPSIAVQEASLHGLGHWVLEYPGVILPIIDDYLASRNFLRPELASYAKQSRTGKIN